MNASDFVPTGFVPRRVTASSANATQIGGDHYKKLAIEPWHAMEAWMTPDQVRGFFLGNVIKYCARHQGKDGIQDLKKAAHYIEKLIEWESK